MLTPYSLNFTKYREPPIPPEYIRYVTGDSDLDAFLRSGLEVTIMLDLAARRYFGRGLEEFGRVLDFGCGCGRVIRFLEPSGEYYGCDVNRNLIDYCRTNYPQGKFYQNELMPPLLYPDGFFDLVFAFSVFSHLSLEVENEWLRELIRIGSAECAYLLTVHGDWVIEQTLGEEVSAARERGFYYKRVHQRVGSPLDFPDYYEASYHTSCYINDTWSQYFNILAIIRGDQPERYLYGELQFEPQGSIPRFRPTRPRRCETEEILKCSLICARIRQGGAL